MYPEAALISRIRARFGRTGLEVGIGDDAAVTAVDAGHSVVLCSDLLAENVHFRRFHPAEAVAFKAVAVNVSDVAAMGGRARNFLLSLAIPRDIGEEWVDAFFEGIAHAEKHFEVHLAGGDVSSAATIVVDVAMQGVVPTGRAVRRRGARPGDSICVTGPLGGAALGLGQLESGGANDSAVTRFLYPEPPFRVGPKVSRIASAMTDVSDGLAVDLSHILAESRVAAWLDEDRIPVFPGASLDMALHGGEDYELLLTGADLPAEVDGTALHRIGEIVAPDDGGDPTAGDIFLRTGSGHHKLEARGWSHFSD